jgi:signal peptidase I
MDSDGPRHVRRARPARDQAALGSTSMTNDDQDAAETQAVRAQTANQAEPAMDARLRGSDQRDGAAGPASGPGLDGGSGSGDGAGPQDDDQPEDGSRPKRTDRPAGAKGKPARKGSFWRELPVLIVIALVIALVVKTYVVQMFFIPSGSMQDTLQINDRVMVNKLVYHFRPIHPGDIVVFNDDGSWNPAPPVGKPATDPVVRLYEVTVVRLYHAFLGMVDGATQDNGNILIKRVIGVPGDRVVCCNAQGDVTVNGVALSESSYLYPGNSPGSAPTPFAGHFSITVPAGRLWVMGDHRAISSDSRLHTQDPFGGTIPENMVIGRAFVIIWPPSRWRILPIPSTFNQPGIASSKTSAAAASAAPYAPLAAGFVGAIPLTLVQRRVRRRVRSRKRPAAPRAMRPQGRPRSRSQAPPGSRSQPPPRPRSGAWRGLRSRGTAILHRLRVGPPGRRSRHG